MCDSVIHDQLGTWLIQGLVSIKRMVKNTIEQKNRTLQYFVALLTLHLIREKKLWIDWCTEKFPYQRNTWILKYEYCIYIHVKIQPNYG